MCSQCCQDETWDAELIDTLWNVNDHKHTRYLPDGYRINRYIMECKFISFGKLIFQHSELIDTLWNVNCVLLQDRDDRSWN